MFNFRKKVLSKMKKDGSEYNIKIIKKTFKKYEDLSFLLMDFTREEHNEELLYFLFDALMKIGVNLNRKDYEGFNYIQRLIKLGYSEQFILKILKNSLEYGLNVNSQTKLNNTILHTAMSCFNYKGNISSIYKLLIDNGFDSHEENSIIEKFFSCRKRLSKEDQMDFLALYFSTINQKNILLNRKDSCIDNSKELDMKKIYTELEKFGTVLNNKVFNNAPTIGRDEELKKLIISLAKEKKSPLIIGESGIGKSALVYELAYRIQKGDVPTYLKNSIILEINLNDYVANTKYRGEFEKKVKGLIEFCIEKEVIIFIDEIHSIYGLGKVEDSVIDMSNILKYYFDKTGLKIIGITTEEEYCKYFSQNALKRRFDLIIIKEPELDVLFKILSKVLDDYIEKYNLSWESSEIKRKVINLLITVTAKKYRNYFDLLNNPDLAISIIDEAFALIKYYDSKVVKLEYFVEAIDLCDRIYQSAKDDCKVILTSNLPESPQTLARVIDFQDVKKK